MTLTALILISVFLLGFFIGCIASAAQRLDRYTEDKYKPHTYYEPPCPMGGTHEWTLYDRAGYGTADDPMERTGTVVAWFKPVVTVCRKCNAMRI